MTRRGGLAIAVAACAAAALAPPGRSAAADGARMHTVTIAALAYAPESLVVRRGDTVVWRNDDPFPHTVTAAASASATAPAKSAFDSGPMAAGASWRFVARRAGTFGYVCSLHSNMKATLIVE